MGNDTASMERHNKMLCHSWCDDVHNWWQLAGMLRQKQVIASPTACSMLALQAIKQEATSQKKASPELTSLPPSLSLSCPWYLSDTAAHLLIKCL
jgi:hypothetical protein